MRHRAVFLDRDDTLVVDLGFIDHPDKVALVHGAVEAVCRLRRAGFKVVVASNQSGIARGYFDEARLDAIHHRLRELLAAGGAQLDGIYHCPYLEGPEAVVETYRKESELRKPAPGMLLQAATDLDLDLSRSWMIGDSARDIEAGRAAGCRTILVARDGRDFDDARVKPDDKAASLIDAVAIVEHETKTDPGGRLPSAERPGKNEPDGPHSGPYATAERPGEDEPDGPHSGPYTTGSKTNALLAEIRDLLERRQRKDLQDDFSLARLLGTLLQMLAVFIAAWGVLAMLSEDITAALTRFALAGFLQLAMITIRLAGRK